jgi:hypothetical protein
MLLLPSFVKLSLIVTGGANSKGERPGTTPAYIADWWRDDAAAVETVVAKIGRRSVTSNTGDVVGGFKGRRIGEDKPWHSARLFGPPKRRPLHQEINLKRHWQKYEALRKYLAVDH